MGIGNLESVLRAYAGDRDEQPIGELVAAEGLSYAQRLLRLLAVRAPQGLRAARPASATSRPTTCGRCAPRERILRPLSRGPRAARRDGRAGDREGDAGGGLSPRGRDRGLRRPGRDRGRDRRRRAGAAAVRARRSAGSPTSDLGELARRARPGPATSTGRCGRRRWRRSATSPAWCCYESNEPAPLRVTSAVRDREYQELLVRRPTPRRPRSTRCTPPAGRSTSAATTPRGARPRPSSTCSTGSARWR